MPAHEGVGRLGSDSRYADLTSDEVPAPRPLRTAGSRVEAPYGYFWRWRMVRSATVPGEFTGVSTCTHLNDTLRSLADVAVLLPPPTAAAS